MAKVNLEELSENILKQVGGKENITFVIHCATRLRMNVRDKSIVNLDEIKKIKNVIGVQWSGEQLQIIIGTYVSDLYKVVCKDAGVETAAALDENLDAPVKKKFSINTLFDVMAGILAPLIGPMIGAGMIKCLVLVGELMGLLTPEMPTYQVLTFVGDCGFYFMPIFVGAFAAKKFNANMGLGMLVGAMMLHPTFVAAATAGTALSVFGLNIPLGSYASTLFPAMLACWVMSYVERFFTKISPGWIRSLSVPFCTALVMMPLTLCFIAPIGAKLGVYLSTVVIALYNFTGFAGVAVLAGLMPFIIMTGMHGAFVPYLFQSMTQLGYEPIVCSAMILSNLNQGAASLVVGLKSKDEEVRSTAISCAITAIVGGITEPAMYGINVKYKTPLYASCIGSIVAGAFCGLMKVYCYALGGATGLIATVTYIGPKASNLVLWCVSMFIGMGVTMAATFIMYKEKSE